MVMTVMILIIGIMGGYEFMLVCYKFIGSFNFVLFLIMSFLYLKVVRRNEICVFQFSEFISLLNFFSKFQQWYQEHSCS
jgi:hypothetical protein